MFWSEERFDGMYSPRSEMFRRDLSPTTSSRSKLRPSLSACAGHRMAACCALILLARIPVFTTGVLASFFYARTFLNFFSNFCSAFMRRTSTPFNMPEEAWKFQHESRRTTGLPNKWLPFHFGVRPYSPLTH